MTIYVRDGKRWRARKAKRGRLWRVALWLHKRNNHQLCLEARRVVRYDTSPEYLVGTDPKTGKETRLDVTTFGGRPIYQYAHIPRW